MIGSLSFDAAANYAQISDQRIRLANVVRGNETPTQLAAIAAEDKRLELAQKAEETQYQYAIQMEAFYKERFKKNMEFEMRLQNMQAK